MSFDYECALTGLGGLAGGEDDSDGMGDLPVGWTRVTITRRQFNPDWVLLQQVKGAMIDTLLQQIPEQYRAAQRPTVALQVTATYYAMEQDTPMYMADVEDMVFLSDSNEIVEDINDLRLSLGLDPVGPSLLPPSSFSFFPSEEDDDSDDFVNEDDDSDDEEEEVEDDPTTGEEKTPVLGSEEAAAEVAPAG